MTEWLGFPIVVVLVFWIYSIAVRVNYCLEKLRDLDKR